MQKDLSGLFELIRELQHNKNLLAQFQINNFSFIFKSESSIILTTMKNGELVWWEINAQGEILNSNNRMPQDDTGLSSLLFDDDIDPPAQSDISKISKVAQKLKESTDKNTMGDYIKDLTHGAINGII